MLGEQIVIAGGYDKGLELSHFVEALSKRKACVLIGPALGVGCKHYCPCLSRLYGFIHWKRRWRPHLSLRATEISSFCPQGRLHLMRSRASSIGEKNLSVLFAYSSLLRGLLQLDLLVPAHPQPH